MFASAPASPDGWNTLMALLETNDLTVSYGGVHANSDVNLEIERGSFVGLIGPNGAGKTTFIDAITGFVPTARGSATFDGKDLLALKPHERARAGLTRTFQSLELFDDLSVEDNMLVAAERPRWYSFLQDIVAPRRSTGVEDQVAWALDVLDLGEFRDAHPSDLSHGQRKLIGVARALATQPQLLLLDEPAAGLDTAESHVLGRRLRSFLDHGITVFLIDHDMGLVLNVCDYIYVLDFGEIIATGTPDEIRVNPTVIQAYLGEHATELQEADAQGARDREDDLA
jgi:branched-chain amino acid transport system ATP-binding protein